MLKWLLGGRGSVVTRTRRPWRKNVLWLFAFGYLSVVIVFCLLAFGPKSKLTVAEAGDLVQGPLMALVGGSIAVAKDLLQIDRDDAKDEPDPTPPPAPSSGDQTPPLGGDKTRSAERA